MRVAAFSKYGPAAASTRQRLLQFVPALEQAGIHVDHHPLISDDYVRSLATGGGYSRLAIIRSYARRVAELVRQPRYDALWVYAELFPFLPAVFERLAFRPRRPLIYDFDDAFFVGYQGKPALSGKTDGLIAGAATCCCGNQYLLDHALRLNSRSIVLPTVVDTSTYLPLADIPSRPPTIGWIGSPSTWRYVRPLLPLIEELCDRRAARFVVVGAGREAETDRFDAMEIRQWSEDREIVDVQSMDIGIMPLPDDSWARGKSGYKLVQYMACGLPVVASPVGANQVIVENGKNGFLARSRDNWASSLDVLLQSPELRRGLGRAGRERIVSEYSLQAQAPRLVGVIQTAISCRPRLDSRPAVASA